MQRRKFIAGLGSLAAAGAAGIGTGAFTSVQADRTVSVNTAADNDAFLAFETSGATNSAYVSNADSGAVSFNLDGDADVDGTGVNQDGTTQINDIVKVRNQGTQPVLVYVEPDSIDESDRTTSDGFGVDPQASNRPNGDYENTSSIAAGVEDDQISLTGLYSEPPYSAYGGGNDGKQEFLLDSGQAFDFGLYVNTGDSSVDQEISMKITADATAVPDTL
ncbi:hypothetical protein [Halobacterium sp. CBA1126]|uniref:hypothetical protein n=1 Tax=Halobacterium sp. CBA1126 TaxID=2668074 RepID=UPI0012FB193E|nr:hypothetical protein [Halobacterium sp. CBA1126]MUV60633.1 hypothetical protein [Halobacterium sp. CBA1126]